MKTRITLMLASLLALPAYSALGTGPVDGEVTLGWWANDFDPDLAGGELDAGAVGGAAQLWWRQRWGLQGALYRSDLADSAGSDDSDYLSIDLKRRLLSPTENNYLAAGFGYEHLDMNSDGDTQGVRLLLEGRLGLAGTLYAYGESAWIPAFADTAAREDLDAVELKLGVGFSPLPFMTVSAGWRKFALDFTDTATGDGRNTSASGPVFEAGIKW